MNLLQHLEALLVHHHLSAGAFFTIFFDLKSSPGNLNLEFENVKKNLNLEPSILQESFGESVLGRI